jgi:hypothetical protein
MILQLSIGRILDVVLVIGNLMKKRILVVFHYFRMPINILMKIAENIENILTMLQNKNQDFS